MKWSRGPARRIFFVFSLFVAATSYHTEATADQLILTWVDSSTNESGFKIERKIGTPGTYAQVATVGANVTSYSDANVATTTTYCYRVRAFNSAGVSGYSNEACGTAPAISAGGTPPPGLVAAYSFNEGSSLTASDSSGNGNTGTLVNSPTWTTGKAGSALSFNGVNQYMRIANSPSLKITRNITITAWVKGLGTSYQNPIVAKHYGLAIDDYVFYIPNNGVMRFFADRQSPYDVQSSVAIPDTTNWHHVAVTRNNGIVTFYLDGKPAGSSPMTGNFNATASPVDIGCDIVNCNSANGLVKGSVDEVRIYNRALSISEIQTIMNTAVGTTPSTATTSSGSSGGTSSPPATGTSASVPVSQSGNVKIGFFRPSTGKWYLDLNGNGVWDGCQVDGCRGPFGQQGNFPVVGDWTGTGTAQLGIFDPRTGLWKLDRNGNGVWDGCTVDLCLRPFGKNGDLPVVGHWKTTSGTDKIGFFRPSRRLWQLDHNGNGVWDDCQVDGCRGPFGISGDRPVAGDWNGTGRTKIGVFDPPTGLWELDLNGNGTWDGCKLDGCLGPFGQAGDIPVVGRW